MDFSHFFVFCILIATSVNGMELSRLKYREKRECPKPPSEVLREPQPSPVYVVYRAPLQPQAPPLSRPSARPPIVYSPKLVLLKTPPYQNINYYRPERQVRPPPLPFLLGDFDGFQYQSFRK